MQDQLDKIRAIGREMGKTDEDIDREIAIGRKNAINGKMSAQMAINQIMMQEDNQAAKAVGKRLRELRKAKGMVVEETAEKAGIKTSTLTAIEEGRYNTGIRQITDIAHTLGAKVAIVQDEQPIRSYL